MAIYMTGVTTQTVAGDPLPIAYGGTGQATAAAAINALLPLQTDNTDKVLKTDGVNVSWATVESGGGAVTSVAGKTGVVTLVKADVGLGNVDNTSDIDKPVSTAQQTALNLKADLASPTFTGTVSGITAAMVGAPAGSGTSTGANTGDDTAATIRSKLGITTLSGSNTGDQTTITGNAGTATALSAGTDRTKLDSLVNYTHPANHPASVITQDSSNRFVTDAEKGTWDAKGVGDVTLTGAQTLTNKTIKEITFAVTGTTPVFGATDGGVRTWTLTGNSAPTVSITGGYSFILIITPGAFSITWPTIVWTKQGGSGVVPTLFSAGKTMVVLWTVGAVLYGSHLGDTV